jgi:hypothetical protein
VTIATDGLSPYEHRMAALRAELIPTRPAPAPRLEPPPKPITPWTRAEQDAHWAALCEALGTPGAPRPHLRVVPDAADTDAA